MSESKNKRLSIGMLAAEGLNLAADRACHRLAQSIGERFSLPPPQVEGSWRFLVNLANSMSSKAGIEALAADQIYSLLGAALRQTVKATKHICLTLPAGESLWEQYSDGLIHESEYLSQLVILINDNLP